ncbi:unnamed protein product [Mytilus coruscus]|uniref:Histidine N-acetyltransferase C-terminal domain-containing protein n=1 Tax=Mytilus coruscus TaxID=42192 RepID=A0A6J8AE79_MYTCO|nr:unnamed protein product [Mytilus coruscus]
MFQIAFSLAYVIDDGETFVSKSSRVATKYEGKGVMKWLFKEMADVVKASTCVLNLASLYFYESDEKPTYHLTESKAIETVDRAFTEFYINRRDLVTSKEKFYINTPSEIELLDRHKLEVLLTLPHTSMSLFPERRVVIDLVPYRAIKPNVAYMIQTTTSVIGSKLDDANSVLISFGDYSEVYRVLLYYIDVYGNVMVNIEAHIQYHMEQIKNIQSNSNNILILIYFEKHAKIALVIETMRKLGFGLEENNPQNCLSAFTEFYINRRNLVTSKEKFFINTTSEIKLLDRQKLEVLLTSPHTSASLFPECRVVIDLVPYRPIKPNVAYMIQTTTSVIGSNLDDANSALISFGDYSEVYRGLLYYIDIYGNVMKNIEAHIQNPKATILLSKCTARNMLILT